MERRLQLLANAVPALLSYVDRDFRYVFVNRYYQDWFGLPPESIVGQTMSDILGAAAFEQVRPYAERALAGKAVDYEMVLPYSHGGPRHVCATYTPDVHEGSPEVAGFIAVVLDISAQKRLEQRLSDALAQAETANRDKDEFIAAISHDLRTPLNAIVGWGNLMRQGSLDPQTTRRALDTIVRNAQAQEHLVNDLIDLARLSGGRLRLDVQEVELIPIIMNAVETLKPAADVKTIRLETRLDPSAEPVLGDPTRLQQIVWNLVSNAIKFTPEEGRVCVALERAGKRIRMRVSDTGQGISAEFLPHVFERFRQSDSGRSGGVGLGLAIVRHLVELHGGSVCARSAGPHLGAEFVVEIPWWNPKNFEIGAPNDTTVSVDLEGMRILLVDEDVDDRELLTATLRTFKADARAVSSREEALAIVPEWRPEALVSDLKLSSEDGLGLIKAVRALPAEKGGDVPAIALTGYVRAEDHRRVIDAGYQVHLAKPVSPPKLVAVLGFVRRQSQPAGAGVA